MLETFSCHLSSLFPFKRKSHFGTGTSKSRYEKKRSERKSTATADSINRRVRFLKQAVFIASMLQVQTSGCLGCRSDQVTWRSSNKAQNDTCLACIDCPDGLEPSIPCGTTAKFGTHLHCVICRVGTYSNRYGKEQCMPCSLCSMGRTVTRNCSATKNTVCGPCRRGYYKDHVVSSCLPCSFCCWDGRDQFESGCKAQGLAKHLQCTPRHEARCQPSETTTMQPGGNVVISNQSAKQRPSKSQTTRTTMPIPSLKQESFVNTTKSQVDNVSSFTPTATVRHKLGNGTSRAVTHPDNKVARGKSRKHFTSSSINKARIIMGLCLSMATLILLAIVAKRNKIAHYLKWIRCRPRCWYHDLEVSERTESSMLDDIRVSNCVKGKGVLIPLCQLKATSFDDYQRTWKRLDKQLEGTMKGDFRDVAQEFGLVQEDIWELEKELKTPGSGSPSRQLLECLATRWPELTIFDFIKVLQKPNIDRDDIVNILKDYIYR